MINNAPVKLFCPHMCVIKKGGALENEVKKGGALENKGIKVINWSGTIRRPWQQKKSDVPEERLGGWGKNNLTGA